MLLAYYTWQTKKWLELFWRYRYSIYEGRVIFIKIQLILDLPWYGVPAVPIKIIFLCQVATSVTNIVTKFQRHNSSVVKVIPCWVNRFCKSNSKIFRTKFRTFQTHSRPFQINFRLFLRKFINFHLKFRILSIFAIKFYTNFTSLDKNGIANLWKKSKLPIHSHFLL